MVPKVASSIRQIPDWGFSICASISSLSHQQIIRSYVRVHICLSHDVLYSDESIFLKRACFQVSNVIVSTVAPWFIFANTNMDHSFIHYMVKFLEYHMYTQDADWTKTNRTNSGEGILMLYQFNGNYQCYLFLNLNLVPNSRTSENLWMWFKKRRRKFVDVVLEYVQRLAYSDTDGSNLCQFISHIDVNFLTEF